MRSEYERRLKSFMFYTGITDEEYARKVYDVTLDAAQARLSDRWTAFWDRVFFWGKAR